MGADKEEDDGGLDARLGLRRKLSAYRGCRKARLPLPTEGSDILRFSRKEGPEGVFSRGRGGIVYLNH